MRYKGAFGGRGSGKSWFFAELAVAFCLIHPIARIVCVREVQKSLRESVKLLLEDRIRHFEVGSHFGITDKEIRTPGGGIIMFQGMQDHTAESIKSLEGFDIAYVEEAQTLTERSLEFLRPTIRRDPTPKRPGSELWFSWNPRAASDPVDAFLRGPVPPADAVVVRTSYRDNPWFPEVLEQERLYDEINKPQRYGHIWLGEYEPMAAGAIWDRLMIHQGRRSEVPRLTRIVVGVDPAVTNTEKSDEHGIIVAAIGEDGRGYVLEDASLSGSPEQWARRAIAAYDAFEADAIVAEVNQGGDMVRHTIHSVRPGVRVISVRASRGKHVRAEPISALYATGKVSHVGAFPKLEGQMCLMTAAGYEGEDSPDRVDALVWALTELFPKLTRRTVPAGGRQLMQANSNYSVMGWRR